jgi:hypothetical protein
VPSTRQRTVLICSSAAQLRPNHFLPSNYFSGLIIDEYRFAFDTLLYQPRHIGIKGSELWKDPSNPIEYPDFIRPEFDAIEPVIGAILGHCNRSLGQPNANS